MRVNANQKSQYEWHNKLSDVTKDIQAKEKDVHREIPHNGRISAHK